MTAFKLKHTIFLTTILVAGLTVASSAALAAVVATELTTAANGSQQITYTTASITPGANRLILAWIFNSNNNPVGTPTLSGNGLTWVQVNTVTWNPVASPDYRITLFRAMGAAPTAGSVSITFPVNQRAAAWSIIEFSGVDTSGTDGSGAVLQNATGSDDAAGPAGLTITLPSAIGSGNATAGGFGNNSNVPSISPGAGYTAFSEVNTSNPNLDLRAEWRADGNTNVRATQTGAHPIAGIAVEIKASSLDLVKQVWQVGGTAPLAMTNGSPTLANVPSGSTLVFLIYVRNSGGAQADVRFSDLLDITATGFTYVAASLVRTNAAAPPADTATDLQIFNATAPGTGTAQTDAVDGDVASRLNISATQDRITVGNTTGLIPAQVNGVLSIAASTTFAIRFQATKP